MFEIMLYPHSNTKKKTTKPLQNQFQKTFNKLKKQIANLQAQMLSAKQELDEYLLFYQRTISPAQNELHAAHITIIKLLYKHYSSTISFSRKQRHILKNIIIDKIVQIYKIFDFRYVDKQLADIFKELEGIDYQEVVLMQLNDLKERLQTKCKARGLDVDLSDITIADDQEQLHEKIADIIAQAEADERKQKEDLHKDYFNKFKAAVDNADHLDFVSKQKQDLSAIYKKLAKIVHPDLELDMQKKNEKEQIMKKLSCAYSSNDLHTILLIETEVMKKFTSSLQMPTSDEQLNNFNLLLKKQIVDLKIELKELIRQPKYAPIEPFFDFCADMAFNNVYNELKNEIKQIKAVIRDLKGKNAENVLWHIMQ